MIVFVTGAESTGKSTLSRQLAEHFGVPWVPEFAREYLNRIHRAYSIIDLEHIARTQIKQIENSRNLGLVFFDTGLIITKVWFEFKYGFCPDWLTCALRFLGEGKYLLCKPDIPWEYDPLRENPDKRQELHDLYVSNLEHMGFEWEIVMGTRTERLENAISAVDRWIKSEPGKYKQLS